VSTITSYVAECAAVTPVSVPATGLPSLSSQEQTVTSAMCCDVCSLGSL
jgi:hypothetical protein